MPVANQAAEAKTPALPDFEKDIAPLLERKCLSCHSADQAKGDFVLETRAGALEHGTALAPGDAAGSKLITLVTGPEPEMPKRGKPLTAEETARLRAWIEAGAPWPEDRVLEDRPERDLDWWSLAPLKKPPVPGAEGNEGLAKNPVDAFLDAALEKRGLAPVKAAEPGVLIRRLTYDLTGLPPTPTEVTAFLEETKTDPEGAWERLVDRLLASPAFGEKFGQHWLDLARYAETHGYDKDKPREHAWPYRDYVIRSFNEDKPYARFVREQVAGDVLYPGEPDGVLALGFLAAGPWDFIGHKEVGEGKLDGRIAKHLDRDEMIAAVFNVFQSTTIQCAQCHQHKFDPITMEDYYRLHAVFAAVDRADRVFSGLSLKEQEKKDALTARVAALREEQTRLDAGLKQLVAAQTSGLDRRLAELKEQYGTDGKQAPEYGYHSKIEPSPDREKWVQVDLGQERSVSQVRLIPAYDSYAGIGAGFGFPVRFKVEASNDPEFKKGTRLLLDATQEGQPSPGSRPVVAEAGGKPFRYIRVTATRLRERKGDYIFALGELELLSDAGGKNYAREAGVKVTANDSIESKPRWSAANLVDGRFFQELSDPTSLVELRELQSQREAIAARVRPPETEARLAAIEKELAKLNGELKSFPEGQFVYAAATNFRPDGRFIATGGTPRPIHLLNRGDLRAPGALMTPGAPPLWEGAPASFGEAAASGDEGAARAELARYLTDPENPLLWRSMANRVWQWVFTQPLAATPNDFGRMGQLPTHPELLDYLAARLRDDPGQSVKSLVRLLATSRAYRRASANHDGNAKIDAGNAYLWRAHRRRLTAEEFRDTLLAVSGDLRLEERGGPSFRDFVIEKPQHSPHYEYALHDPEDPAAYRRTIYRFVVRSQPQPLLTTLDCADPSLSVPQRDESTTALQALTQWNSRFVETVSRHLAARLRKEAPDSPEARLDLACRLALGRPPDETERTVLLAYLNEQGEAAFARVLFNLNAFAYLD